MREIFVHQDFTRVGHFKSLLDSAGIASFIRNEVSHNSVTELPSPILFPTLCVEDDADYDKALELLREVYQPHPSDNADWTCGACKETVPGNFESCWSCSLPKQEA